jgi:hypothetical protein
VRGFEPPDAISKSVEKLVQCRCHANLSILYGTSAQIATPISTRHLPLMLATNAAKAGYNALILLSGAPEEIRTPDPQIRSLVLDPVPPTSVTALHIAGTYKEFFSVRSAFCALNRPDFLSSILSSCGRVIGCRSLQVLNRLSQCPSRDTGLGHDVVLFRCGECCVTEQVLNAADIDGITNRPESSGRMPKLMQADRKAQYLLRLAPDVCVDHPITHGPTPVDPQMVVVFRTGNPGPNFL